MESNIVSSMLQSANIIAAPSGEAAMGPVNAEIATPKTDTPLVADALDLGQFYLPQAKEMLSPESLTGIKEKIDAISQYSSENVKTPSEDGVKNFINKLVSDNEWSNLKPLDKLEKLFSYVDLQRRLVEMKKNRAIISELRGQINA